MTAPVILWFRQDLRLADQPALVAAASEGPVIPVYILDDQAPRHWRMGAAQRWWLHHSLASLDKDLRRHGSHLVLRKGLAAEEIVRIARETGATRIHAVRHYEPWWQKAEEGVSKAFDLCLHDGNCLAPPDTIRTGSGGPYKIYTPFWRALAGRMPPPSPLLEPRITTPDKWPESEELEDWGLLPVRPNWAKGFDAEWTPGEAGAKARLDAFLSGVDDYSVRRDLPSVEGTSRLSPHLHFGEVSPAIVWHALSRKADAAKFVKELAWRDFAQNMMLVLPGMGDRNGREAFDHFPWRTGSEADADFAAWTKGMTGYPIVDAGMRQLWATGWMHNRVRMIAASFLVKHLLIDWRRGARWFWDTLVDADYGNNSLNWQWIAGSGLDSNPFGRIMAPLTQSPKFDAGGYIRRWVPELADVPDAAIHDPEESGLLCPAYPAKLIGHREARERALAALGRARNTA
ncbi:deoxyribodipyrimidine photo-lyase [Allosphingosinicella flava]|uniref:Deoxyribodipyrimidine photo-lyase n=1 Tax=Allosphingosinicella flava TaxID=2771430 RepID=A0A7T2GK85_9SPHN|nr:deoxyribodipyrimidine photo-lyase [Sphingosinicella flava]QPQ55386.1 deoxyribodipyrimidine photo-lyase [Sphingosinicella flava]